MEEQLKFELQVPAIVHGLNDEGLITSKGFQITKHVPGKRIEFIDPNTGNCFVAKLGIKSVEPISWYGDEFHQYSWHDPDTEEIKKKRVFTKQYGMIIVPQFCLSYTKKEGLCSVGKRLPFTNRTWYESYDLFQEMKLPEGVFISMIAGFEADQSMQHIIDTQEAKRTDLTVDSKIFGGYDARIVYETGREGTPCIDGVYNQTGLVRFWTQEMFGIQQLHRDYNSYVVWAGSCDYESNALKLANKTANLAHRYYRFWSSTGTLLFL